MLTLAVPSARICYFVCLLDLCSFWKIFLWKYIAWCTRVNLHFYGLFLYFHSCVNLTGEITDNSDINNFNSTHINIFCREHSLSSESFPWSWVWSLWFLFLIARWHLLATWFSFLHFMQTAGHFSLFLSWDLPQNLQWSTILGFDFGRGDLSSLTSLDSLSWLDMSWTCNLVASAARQLSRHFSRVNFGSWISRITSSFNAPFRRFR